MKSLSNALWTALTLVSPATTNAAPILQAFTGPSVFFGQDHSLGHAFSSSAATSLTALGVWESNGDGFASSHQVGVFNSAGTLLGLVTLSAGTSNALRSGFRYATLAAPVNLNASATYFLAGTTLDDDWVFQASSISMAPGFSYLGSYFTSFTGGLAQFPASFAAGREYMTVHALTGADTVPEPLSLSLPGTGLAAMVARRQYARRNG